MAKSKQYPLNGILPVDPTKCAHKVALHLRSGPLETDDSVDVTVTICPHCGAIRNTIVVSGCDELVIWYDTLLVNQVMVDIVAQHTRWLGGMRG